MDRDELENKINEMIDCTNSFSPDAIEAIYSRKKAILAEHDRLTAEIDRLRWYYPEDRELPEDENYILLETYQDSEIYNIVYFGHDENHKCENNNVLNSYRWKYIEKE